MVGLLLFGLLCVIWFYAGYCVYFWWFACNVLLFWCLCFMICEFGVYGSLDLLVFGLWFGVISYDCFGFLCLRVGVWVWFLSFDLPCWWLLLFV